MEVPQIFTHSDILGPGTFQVSELVGAQSVVYLKECLKCTLLRFSFSGSWDAMWENSLKMSR